MGDIKSVSEIIESSIPYYKKKGEPDSEHKLVYDSPSETLEPVYYFILDLMNNLGLDTEKLIDNFSSSPGSGHFGELGQRSTIMQQQGTKILGDINTVLRSILNLIYDLRDFRIRLQSYQDLKNTEKKESAMLSLKQVWLDKVDMQKGNSSIKGMAMSQAGFVTLIDAFLAAKTTEDAKKLDLNERVKRIVIQRLQEFNAWLSESERELKKRYEIERTYLKSQINSLKLYSRWAKPYLRTAQKLEMQEKDRSPDLVNIFNTMVLELTLLGKKELKVDSEALSGNLPIDFKDKKMERKYYSCVFVNFYFRSIPQRISQQSHYVFGGRAEVTFKAYSLNEDEIKKINKELEKSDVTDSLKLIEGTTTESLEQLKDDIEYFIGDLEEKEEQKKPSNKNSAKGLFEPFLALVGKHENSSSSSGNSEKKEDIDKKIQKETWIESEHLRPLATEKAKENAFLVFNIYKKAHGMANFTP
ncbi:hypothetical protein K9L16_00945 [Candidatus Pacearchaeota archaeon]|nr:hypothetical protein [Candidatus Pacearchaeota archaeon]